MTAAAVLFEELLEGPVQSDEPYPYPFHVGEYDERLRDRMRSKMPSWDILAERREPEFQEFDKLISSVFFSLYKQGRVEMDPITDSAQSIKQLLEIAESMPEWHELNMRTKNDHVVSAIASLVIGEHIVIPEPPPGGDGDGDEQGSGGDGEEGSQMANGPEVREALGKALASAAEAAENAETLSHLWGDEAGEEVYKDPETLLGLVRMMADSDRMKLISRMLGRLRNQLRHSQMARADYIPEEFVDVEFGNSLPDLLPSSKLLLADPDLEVLFLLKYVQRALLQQVREGNTPLDQGPIIVLIDVSGSMSAPMGDIPGVGPISRLDWALAVGLTLTILARRQNREFYIGLFDTHVRREIKSSDGPVTSAQLLDMLAVNTMGGTNFESPLRTGLDIMLESAYDKADLVFITDGIAPVSEEFLQEFRAAQEDRHFRTLGVACASIQPESLAAFCDRTLSAASVIQADDVSGDVFSMGE